MNKKTRKEVSLSLASLREAYSTLDDVLTKISEIKDSEQEKYDNLPEGLQDGELGESILNAIDVLEEGESYLEDAKDNVDSVIYSLEELI